MTGPLVPAIGLRLTVPLVCLVALAGLSGAGRLDAQTVIRDSAPPIRSDSSVRSRSDTGARARTDTAARAGRTDSAAKPGAPAPSPPSSPLPKGACSEADAGGPATDLLLVTFRSRSAPAEREAALKTVKGTLVTPDPSDDAAWFVRVPSGGNEFVLRGIADRLIRAPVVKEVGPVQCPARP